MKTFLTMVLLVLGLGLTAAGAEASKPVPRVVAIRTNVPLNELGTNLSPMTVSREVPLKLGGSVLVTVSNLATLLDEGRDKAKKVVLFVEGIELTDVEPVGIYLEKETLRFQLKRTAANKAVWTPVLQNPITPEFRPLLISVGLHGGQPLLVDEAARGAPLRLIAWDGHTRFWIGVFATLLILFFIMAFGSDILRNPPGIRGQRGAYSLSRVQAAFWLFLTSMSFAFIYLVTRDLTTLNPSVLALLGISAGTYLGSSLLSTSEVKAQGNEEKQRAEETENVRKDAESKAKLAQEAEESLAKAKQEAASNQNPADQSAKDEAVKAAEAAYAAAAKASAEAAAKLPKVVDRIATNFHRIPVLGQFLEDILTEDYGLSIHRFQMFVWTIVLGIIFVISVLHDLVMPEFSATLLGLMGISSATYLTPKLQNK